MGGLLIAASPSIAGFLTSNSIDAIRFAGLGLQVLGLSIVLKEIGQVRKSLDLPPILSSILEWFASASYIFREPKIVQGNLKVTEGGDRVNATGYISKIYRPTNVDPVRKQIETIMKNVDELHAVISRMDQNRTQAVAAIKKELVDALNEERSGRKSLEDKVRAVLAKNHALEILGVILILFGVVFATIPEVIVNVWPSKLLVAIT